jgi:hypothetical protein
VVSHQEGAAPALRLRDQLIHDALGIRPAIDVVAEEDELVAVGERQRFEQLREQLALAVDVPDRE